MSLILAAEKRFSCTQTLVASETGNDACFAAETATLSLSKPPKV